jgi:hypothetical protein
MLWHSLFPYLCQKAGANKQGKTSNPAFLLHLEVYQKNQI